MKKNIITIIISLIIIISLNKPSTVEAEELNFSSGKNITSTDITIYYKDKNKDEKKYNDYKVREFKFNDTKNVNDTKNAYCLEPGKPSPTTNNSVWTPNYYNSNSELGNKIAAILNDSETFDNYEKKSLALRFLYTYYSGKRYSDYNCKNEADCITATAIYNTIFKNNKISYNEEEYYIVINNDNNGWPDFKKKLEEIITSEDSKMLLGQTIDITLDHFSLEDKNIYAYLKSNIDLTKKRIICETITIGNPGAEKPWYNSNMGDCSIIKSDGLYRIRGNQMKLESNKISYSVKFKISNQTNPYNFIIYSNGFTQTMLVEKPNDFILFEFQRLNDYYCNSKGTILDPNSQDFNLDEYKAAGCLCKTPPTFNEEDYKDALNKSENLGKAYLEQCPPPCKSDNQSCNINSKCNDSINKNVIEESIDFNESVCLEIDEIKDKYYWGTYNNSKIYCNEKIELDYPILNEYKVGLGGRLDIKINTEVTLNCIVSGDTVDLSKLVKNNEFNKLDKINFTFDDVSKKLNLTDGQKKFSLKSSNSNGFYDYNNDGKVDTEDASYLLGVAGSFKSLPSGKDGDLDNDGGVTTSDARILLRFTSDKSKYDYNNDGRIDTEDASFLNSVAAKLKSLPNGKIGDLDTDGKVTTSDARILLRIIYSQIEVTGDGSKGSTFTVKYNAVYASSNIPLTSVSTGRIIINSNNKNDIIVPKDNGTGYYISYNTAYGKYEFSINLDLSEHNISLNDLLGKETSCSANYACSYEYTYGYSCIKDKVEYLIPEECNTDEDIKACYKRLCGCECPNCDTPEDKEGNDINYFYRPITLNDVFPNSKTDYSNKNNLSKSRIPGSNWTDEKGLKTQEEIETKGEQIYNNDNANFNNDNTIHYSFTLTPSTMKKIREYNNRQEKESDGYADFTLYCEEGTGLKCESNFLTNLLNVKNYGSYTYLMSSYKQFDFGNYKNSSADLALLNNARKQWQTYTDGTAWK